MYVSLKPISNIKGYKIKDRPPNAETDGVQCFKVRPVLQAVNHGKLKYKWQYRLPGPIVCLEYCD